jgi:23S rRNA (pseudouridine1915-N3)-methyltransferase
MIGVVIVCVGKLKEAHFRDGVAEYAKRLAKYCDFEIVEVADEKIPEHASAAEAAKVLETEGRAILARIPKNAHVISLAVEGAETTSPGLAELIAGLGSYEASKICFVIGGSLGLADAVKRASDRVLSFSRLTFPHQLMRLMLAEQLYRAFTILNRQIYHK